MLTGQPQINVIEDIRESPKPNGGMSLGSSHRGSKSQSINNTKYKTKGVINIENKLSK